MGILVLFLTLLCDPSSYTPDKGNLINVKKLSVCMANAQMHIFAGTIVSLLFALAIYNVVHVSTFVILAGILIGVVSSEFPDIDHPRSLPRKVLRGIMPTIIVVLFGYLFFIWKIWNHGIFIISAFFATPIILVLSYEYFIPKHRGATHKLPGMAVMIALTIPFVLAVGPNFVNLIVLVSFAVLGFSTHVVLDHI